MNHARILLVDNFDSFTYNLVQGFQTLGAEVHVIRNTALFEQLDYFPTHLVISPGPGKPQQAGISKGLIDMMAGKVPILGVCLGHQCIGEVYGGKIVRARMPMHGKKSEILHDSQGLFTGLAQRFTATRYHSLAIDRPSLPSCLQITADTEDGEIMGVRHREIAGLEGVQFHPESISTEFGMDILKNFLILF